MDTEAIGVSGSTMKESVEVRQMLDAALRWWWLLIVATMTGAVIGYTFSKWQPPVYQATTTLLVGQSILSIELDSRDITTSERLALTYANVVQLQPVLQSVIDKLALDLSWQELKGRVMASVVEGTQLLRIKVEANSPESATSIADELAGTLILVSPTTLQRESLDANQKFVQSRLENLRENIAETQVEIDRLEDSISSLDSVAQIQNRQLEIDGLQKLIVDWENNYARLLAFVKNNGSPNYLTVVEPAQAPASPIRPRILLNTLAAALIGFLLVMGFAVFQVHSDPTITSAGDLQHVLNLAALGTIGHISGHQNRHKLKTLLAPASPTSQAFAMLQINIQHASGQKTPKSIVVTSPGIRDGKSLVAANLAVVMAQSGFRTIIVDMNLTHPMLHRFFNVPNTTGVVNLLDASESKIMNYLLRDTGVDNLQLLTSGTKVSERSYLSLQNSATNPDESRVVVTKLNRMQLLTSDRLEQLVPALSKFADLIIFDTSPTLTAADVTLLSKYVDGVILVVKARQTRIREARQAVLSLEQAGANLLGGVLNGSSLINGGQSYRLPDFGKNGVVTEDNKLYISNDYTQ